MIVRLMGNTVVEIIPSYATPISKYYSVDFCASCVEAPDDVEQYWIYDPTSDTFSKPQVDLSEIKLAMVQQSKVDLATYLDSHPIKWTDGEYYSITAERQAQLTSTLVCAQADGQPPEWNSTGGVCREWDVQELTSLGVYIKDRVKSLVKYQQQKEIEINNASTQEELDNIVVDYDEVE